MRILAVSGSIQERSANRALLALARSIAPQEVVVTLAPPLDRLPYYNADEDGERVDPAVADWRRALREADGVLISSPEYGHNLPGVLKNALDWIVGSGELVEKPVVATTAAQGKGRGLLGLASLIQTLRAIDARVVWGYPVIVPRASIDSEGRIADPEIARELTQIISMLIKAAKAF